MNERINALFGFFLILSLKAYVHGTIAVQYKNVCVLKAYKHYPHMEVSFSTLAHWEVNLIINCPDSENIVRVKSPHLVPVICNALRKF